MIQLDLTTIKTVLACFVLFVTVQISLNAVSSRSYYLDTTPTTKLSHNVPAINLSYPTSLAVSDQVLISQVERSSNIPLGLLLSWSNYEQGGQFRGVHSCANVTMPTLDEIHFNNLVWQTVEHGTANAYFLLSAYYDDRGPEKFVRVVGMRKYPGVDKLWCYLFFDNTTQVAIVKADLFHYHDEAADYDASLLSCKVPAVTTDGVLVNLVPRAVSVLTRRICPTKPTNLVRVVHQQRSKNNEFAVCLQALRFYHVDMSVRIIEWLEYMRLMGVGKVIFNYLDMHPNIEKTLKYYEKMGLVELRGLTLPDSQPNVAGLYQYYAMKQYRKLWSTELVGDWDCYLRNMAMVKYVGVFDIDEIIFPVRTDNYHDLFDTLKKKHPGAASYEFWGARTLTEMTVLDKSLPGHNLFYTLEHPYRGGFNDSRFFTRKSVHTTDKTLHFNQHVNFGCHGSRTCKEVKVDTADAYYIHYRDGWDAKKECGGDKCVKVYDDIFKKYQDRLETNMVESLRQIFG